jgi:hypothetical protein
MNILNPVTIILVLLLVLVTILYFTKKPKDRFELSSNFKEVSLPLSSPDGKFKLEYEEITEDGIKNTFPIFRYGNESTETIKDLFTSNSDYYEEIYNAFGITNQSIKYYEYYSGNIYKIVMILNEIFIINKTNPILTSTKPKISLSDDKKFVISNITYPGVPNEAKYDVLFPTITI